MATTEQAKDQLYFEPQGLESNDAATSIGEDLKEADFDYSIPLNNYEITKVLDDVILLTEVEYETDDKDGYIETEGGILLSKEAYEGNLGAGIYQAYVIAKVGINVKEVEAGDMIVQSKKSGLEVEFDGSKYLMSREANVMFVVKKKES